MKPTIAVVSPWDLGDEGSWSGVVKPMVAAMRRHADLVEMGGIHSMPSLIDRGLAKSSGLIGRTYLPTHSILTASRASKKVKDRLSLVRVDAVVSLAASTLTLRVPRNVPLLQITDATFNSLVGFYPGMSNLTFLAKAQGNELEKINARRSDHFLVSSEWAKLALVADLAVSEENISVAPFGAGSAAQFIDDTVLRKASSHSRSLKILFVSSNWIRKGGSDVLEIFSQWQIESPESTLTIIGDAPETNIPGVSNLGRLNAESLAREYSSHDVLIEATRANAGGMTLTDAAAFGLPTIGRNIGGVGSIVKDRETGLLVDSRDDFVSTSVSLLRLIRNPDLRRVMSKKARQHYEEKLSWSVWGNNFSCAIEGLLKND